MRFSQGIKDEHHFTEDTLTLLLPRIPTILTDPPSYQRESLYEFSRFSNALFT